MDIVIKTNFNNPNLPVAAFPGFYDDFERSEPTSALGHTIDGKPWQGSNDWSITEDGTSTRDRGTGLSRVWVEGLATNGRITAQLAAQGSDLRNGILFRYQDEQNYLWFCPHTTGLPTLYGLIDGVVASIYSVQGAEIVPGDTMSVEMRDSEISLYLNNELLHERTVTDLVGETKHGFLTFSGQGVEWDYIEFEPY